MPQHPSYLPFNFQAWVEAHRDQLKPPVSNRLLFDAPNGMVIQVIGGGNQRVDFHDDPAQEFFFQVQGDMILKVMEDGVITDVPIREGEVFLLPPHVRHSPQRPQEGSIGLVIEPKRNDGLLDAFEWYCFECNALVKRVEVSLKSIVRDLPPIYQAFYADEKARTCPKCGALHPGKKPPEGWVVI